MRGCVIAQKLLVQPVQILFKHLPLFGVHILAYLVRKDIAAVLAMDTTLDMCGILEVVCTAPTSLQL